MMKLAQFNNLLLIFNKLLPILQFHSSKPRVLLMENKNINRIRSISAKFHCLFSALLFFIPIFTLMYWLFFNHLPVGFTNFPDYVDVAQTLPIKTIILACLASLVPVTVAVYGILNLKELFKLYEKGIFFSERNVQCFRQLGYTLFSWVVANQIFGALISVVLTLNNPPGERMLVIQFSIANIGTLIIAAVVVLISWVMHEATRLEDEQVHTV